jgi:membrane-associated phospholipid phosphatase
LKYFFIILFCYIALSQQTAYPQVLKNIDSDFNNFISTGINLTTDFFTFDKSTQMDLVGSVLLIGAGYSIDNNVKNFSQKNLSSFNNYLFSIDNVYGSGYTLVGIGGLYGYGLFFNDKEIRKIGLQTIEAVGYSGIIESVIKSVVGRSRPYTNEGKDSFHPINFSSANTSFPSGHSTVSFAVSTVLANNTDNLFLKIVCFCASTLVDCARIYHNDHWFSDVITGSLIGYFSGNYVTNRASACELGSTNLSLNFSLTGIDLSLAF